MHRALGRIRSRPGRTAVFVVAVFVIAAVLIVVFAAARSPRSSSSVADRDAISAPPGSRVLVFGDSWVAGYAATPLTEGFAYLLGRNAKWKTTVDGVAGSGFLDPGPNDEGTYSRRIGTLSRSLDPRLVIVEGGINDADADRSDYVATVEATIRQLQRLYPNAAVLLLGPGAYVLPPPPDLVQTDEQLAQAASKVGIPYISPIGEHWITAKNFESVIDTSAANHPSTHGHAVIAARLESALKRYLAP